MAKKKPSFRDTKEYQQFLKSVGYKKTKKVKSIQSSLRDAGAVVSGYAETYYSDTGKKIDSGKRDIDNKRYDFSKETSNTKKEIQRKSNLIRAMNMPAPRDLSDDVPERIIDQKHLITPRIN